MRNRRLYIVIAAVLIAGGLFLAGYKTNKVGTGQPSSSIQKLSQGSKEYYISFDDYYYEVPKNKAADDKIVQGAQFLYDLNKSVKTNTLDDLFNNGAVGVQALVAFNGENQPFERYINEVTKPQAASAFSGSADLSFSNREDGVRAADLLSKKDDKTIRRQYIVNLPQSVAVVSKDDNESFKSVSRTIAQASAKFSDYEAIKIQILAQSAMLKSRMFEDIYNLAHPDLRGATSVDEITTIADRTKEIFDLEPKVSGVKISKNEMSVSVLFIDSKDPSKNKGINIVFRLSEEKWKLFSLVMPNGNVTGAPAQ